MNKEQQVSKRKHYIKTLQEFILSSKEYLHDSLQKLNWTEQETLFKKNEEALVCCPLNPAHRVGLDNVDKHVAMCRWHQKGYKDYSVPLPSSTTCSKGYICIDKGKQADVILQAAAKNPLLKIAPLVRQLALA